MADGYTLCASDDPDHQVFDSKKRKKVIFSGLLAAGICVTVALFAVIVNDHFRFKEIYSRYRSQKDDIAGLKQKIMVRNGQLEALSGKIGKLEAKLSELMEFEDRIRNIAGIEESPDQLSMYGMGGEIIEGIDPEESVWQPADNLVECLNSRLERLNDSTLKKSRSLQALYDILKTQQELLAVTPSIRPVDGGWISSGFGFRKSPFTGHEEYHTGVDIATLEGTPVKAAADGIIHFTGNLGTFGKIVAIDHGFGIISRYGHLGKIMVSENQEVKKGDIIAETGNTGRSTGPHLHYEVRFNGIPMNAEKYMSQYIAENVTQ